LWAAGLVGGDHLTVENGVVDIELACNLIAERVKTAQDIAVARNEPAPALFGAIAEFW
jgi:hypothetical protein